MKRAKHPTDRFVVRRSAPHSEYGRRERETVGPGSLIRTAIALAAALFLTGMPLEARVLPGPASPRGTPTRLRPGNLLVASPGLRDPNFHRTVILVVRHDDAGAFGLVVNRVLGRVKLAVLLKRLGLDAPKTAGEIAVHYGGPVQPERGFLVHSTEKKLPSALPVNADIAVTSNPVALRAIALGQGPRRALFAVGYAGWGPGQLDAEMRRGDWLTAPGDEDILFDDRHGTKWKRAMDRRFRTL